MDTYRLSPAMRDLILRLSDTAGLWWDEVPQRTAHALERRGMVQSEWHEPKGRYWRLTRAGRVTARLLEEIALGELHREIASTVSRA